MECITPELEAVLADARAQMAEGTTQTEAGVPSSSWPN